MPHLVAFAADHLSSKHYDPLFLSACIELARLEGRGPAIPVDLEPAYRQAVAAAHTLAEEDVSSAWDRDSDGAIRASAAALGGDVSGAQSLLDADDTWKQPGSGESLVLWCVSSKVDGYRDWEADGGGLRSYSVGLELPLLNRVDDGAVERRKRRLETDVSDRPNTDDAAVDSD